MAASPVSGGTSQPDILTMLHATKGTDYNLGDLQLNKILKYEERLKECLADYMIPPEATQVSPLIPFPYAWWCIDCKHTNDERLG